MPGDSRDAWIRAYLDDVFNGRDLQSLDRYTSENLVSHWLGDRDINGRKAWRDAMSNFFNAFPDADTPWMTFSVPATKAFGGDLARHAAERVGGHSRDRPQSKVDGDYHCPV